MAGTTQQTGGISPEALARYEPVIGLEVHLQLKTASKIFCSCSTRFGDAPNSNTCPVCLGLPGALPVLNRGALELAIRAALALHCTVQERSRFARKNYFYPDLPKGYQISMYEMPLATGGWLEIPLDGAAKRVGITRLHMEDDAAKNLHEGFSDSDRSSYIDFNRCGVPLVEIVSEPDIRSPDEAYAYLTTLKQVLEYTDVSDCNMEEGSLRCDANVSVRRRGEEKFGTKAEVKNLNSFRYLQRALEFEIERQVGVLESGGRIEQETRLWNVAAGRTEPMRSKEFAHDYRYFPEPDLLPVHVSENLKAEILKCMPELPDAKRARFLREFQMTPYDAGVLTATRALADYFEASVKAGAPPKSAANWIQTELLRCLNDAGKEISQSPIAPASLAALLKVVESGQITGASGKKVFAKMFESGGSAEQIIAAEGLTQISDTSEIERIAHEIIEKNPQNVAKYKSGNEGVFKFFVGQVMRASRGQANPQLVNQIVDVLIKLLGPLGSIPRQTYEDILLELDITRAWVSGKVRSSQTGRFSEYKKKIQELIEARRMGSVEDLGKLTEVEPRIWSLLETMQLNEIARGLRTLESEVLSEKLEHLLSGPLTPTQEDENSNIARNTMFEMMVAALLSSSGISISLPKQGPDIVASSGKLQFAIECKRIQSEKGLEEQLKKAVSQLEKYAEMVGRVTSFVAVDVTKIWNPGDKIYVKPTADAARKGLSHNLSSLLVKENRRLHDLVGKRIGGIIFHICTPAFIESDEQLTVARYVTIWTAHETSSTEYRALEEFATKLSSVI